MNANNIPAGYELVAVKGLGELMYWLDRCSYKGHLENCADLIEPYEAFDWRRIEDAALAATPASPQAPAPQAVVGEASEALVLMVDYAIHHGWPYDAQKRIEGIREADKQRAALTPSPAPSAAPHQGADALREALAGDVCPLCGGKGLHKHSPEEIVIFRNGAKFARRQQDKAEFDEIMSASEEELDAMLRAEGIDPDEAAPSGRRAGRAHHQAPQQGEQHV